MLIQVCVFQADLLYIVVQLSGMANTRLILLQTWRIGKIKWDTFLASSERLWMYQEQNQALAWIPFVAR